MDKDRVVQKKARRYRWKVSQGHSYPDITALRDSACTIAASLAVMLPVATPPNAIAFSFGKIFDMVKAGFMLNIIGILCINLGINTWGYIMFDIGMFLQWANTYSKP